MVKARNDLTGKVFGRLTVICQSEDYISSNGRTLACWKCRCDCGNIQNVIGDELKRGHTKSCGCLKKEILLQQAKECKKYNDYEVQEDYVIMYTLKGEPFFVDLEDFWRVRDICWHKNEDNYICGKYHNKIIKIHRLITGCDNDKLVDHIGGYYTRNDNRKFNLRIGTDALNARNRKGKHTGVCWMKKIQRWQAYITINKKNIYLGRYKNYEDALKARKEAEKKYFKNWSYDVSQEMYKSHLQKCSVII